MKNMYKLVLLVLSLFLVFGLTQTQDVNAQAFAPQLDTANGTEFNTQTPTINITVIGDEVNYTGNISFNYTSAIFDADTEADLTINIPIIYDSITMAVTLPSALPLRTTIFLNISFWNETMDVMNSTGEFGTGGIPVILINGRPTLTVSVEDKIPIKGHSLTFTATVTDGNSTGVGNDHTKIVICADSSGFSVAGGCTGTEYCRSSSFVAAGTSQTCSYTIPYTMTGGAHIIYTYAFDDGEVGSLASTTAYESVFTTASGIIEEEPEEEEEVGSIFKTKGALGIATDVKVAGIPLWVIIVAVVVIVGAVWIKKKKS